MSDYTDAPSAIRPTLAAVPQRPTRRDDVRFAETRAANALVDLATACRKADLPEGVTAAWRILAQLAEAFPNETGDES